MSIEEFTMLQLAGKVERWTTPVVTYGPRWWTRHYKEDGEYICVCGEETDYDEDLGNS